MLTTVLAALALTAWADVAAAAEPGRYRVTVRRTSHGIPHVIAADWASLAYGYGYSLAQDNICVLADMYTTVRAERSRYFGPDASWTNRGNSTTANNLNSDFFYKKIIDQRTVERLLAEPPPAGPLPEISEGVRGYVAGYNAYLREVGVDNISDPACRGKPWVKPLEEIDAYRRFYSLALLASSGVAVDGIGGASPLVTIAAGERATAAERAKVTAAQRAQRNALSGMTPNRFDELLGGIGSNAVRPRQRGDAVGPRDGARQPALPVGRLRALLPGPADHPGQARRGGRLADGRAAHQHRLHPAAGVEPHRLHGETVHAVPAEPGPRPADELHGRRRGQDDEGRPTSRSCRWWTARCSRRSARSTTPSGGRCSPASSTCRSSRGPPSPHSRSGT